MNNLDIRYVRWPLPPTLDGREVSTGSRSFSVDSTQYLSIAKSKQEPFTLSLNKTTTITKTGVTPRNGTHKINMKFEIPGLGLLQFDFTDMVTND